MAQKSLLNMVQGTLAQGCVLSMEKGTPIVGAMEFVEIKGNAYSFNVVDTLISTEHRELGEEVTANEMQTEKLTKELVILTNAVKTDRALQVMGDITDIKAQNTELAMMSNGKALEKKVVAELKGALAKSEAGKEFTGALTVDILDDAVDYCNPNMIFVNAKGQRVLKKLLKAEGHAPETIESFGKRVIAYDGRPVHVSADLSDNEILFVNFDINGVHGITNGGLKAYEERVNVFDITHTELLYNVVYKVKNSFAMVKASATKSK